MSDFASSCNPFFLVKLHGVIEPWWTTFHSNNRHLVKNEDDFKRGTTWKWRRPLNSDDLKKEYDLENEDYPKNEDELKNEENLKNENNLKNDDNFKNGDGLKNEDDFKNEINLKNENDVKMETPSKWGQPENEKNLKVMITSKIETSSKMKGHIQPELTTHP